jgi:ParB family chromosome partitioning protein
MANAIKLNLPSADSLFSTQEERDDAKLERVINLPLPEISDFPNHPFKVRLDAEMTEMAESVKKYGVLVPGLVRPKDGGGYEMVAGHRRKMASELAERGEMPCIVRNLTDDEAIIIMVDSNLQREQILPSEKAFAYKMKLEAMNRQGQRTDLTSTPLVSKLRTNEKVGLEAGDSREQVRRYIRLTELIPELLEMVDNAATGEKPQIAMRPAVELSYLPKEHQQTLHDAIGSEDCTPSHIQAMKMRKFADEGRLSADVILSIMQEEKPNQVEQFKLPKEKISRFFAPGTPVQKIENDIIRGLELLQRQRERSRDAR